jgi:Na+-transporting NADH:ubiquinone oxidoreductase subunit NqrE
MYDEGALAKTGLGTLTIFGVGVGIDWLLAIVIALILIGAFTYRVAKRNGTRG